MVTLHATLRSTPRRDHTGECLDAISATNDDRPRAVFQDFVDIVDSTPNIDRRFLARGTLLWAVQNGVVIPERRRSRTLNRVAFERI